jgi:hypothetical protein
MSAAATAHQGPVLSSIDCGGNVALLATESFATMVRGTFVLIPVALCIACVLGWRWGREG